MNNAELFPAARVIKIEDADFGDVSLRVVKPLNGEFLDPGIELYFSPDKGVEALIERHRESAFQHGFAVGFSLAALAALLAVVIARVTNWI